MTMTRTKLKICRVNAKACDIVNCIRRPAISFQFHLILTFICIYVIEDDPTISVACNCCFYLNLKCEKLDVLTVKLKCFMGSMTMSAESYKY